MTRITALTGTYRGRCVAVRFNGTNVDDILADPPDSIPRPGTIFRALPDRPTKGLGGAILRLPNGLHAFIRNTKGLRPGAPITVQVSGFAEPGKAIPVSDRLLLKGRLAILTPGAEGRNISRQVGQGPGRDVLESIAQNARLPNSCGLILRAQSEGVDEGDILAEIDTLARTVTAITADASDAPALLHNGPDAADRARQEWSLSDDLQTATPGVDTDMLLDAIESALTTDVPLPSAGSMIIEPTRALVAVDVNTGVDLSPAAGLKANIAAARALPCALRCRGLGGQIVIDCAPSPKKHRAAIESALKAAFRADPVDTALVGWTRLGHFELQRKRERYPLRDIFHP